MSKPTTIDTAGHQIRHVATIFPVVIAASGCDALWTDTIHNEVNAGVENGAHALAADLQNAAGLSLRFDDLVASRPFEPFRRLRGAESESAN